MVVACCQDHVFYILAGGHNLLVACFFFQIEVICKGQNFLYFQISKLYL